MHQKLKLEKIANKTHGVLTRKVLLENNFSSCNIRSLIESETLKRTAKGIYVLIGSMPTWSQKANIAIFSCGQKARLSHTSVLKLFDLLPDSRKFKYDPIHVLNPFNDFRSQKVCLHRSKFLDTYDLSNCTYGIQHVSLERAFIDSAQRLNDQQLSFLIDKALSKRLISIERLSEILTYLPVAPGRETKRVRELTDDLSRMNNLVATESIFEKRIEKLLTNSSKFELQKQYNIMRNGRKYRLDFAIPEIKLAIEADGFNFHKDRYKFDHDRKKSNDLSILGWNILHLTATMTDRMIIDTFKSMIL